MGGTASVQEDRFDLDTCKSVLPDQYFDQNKFDSMKDQDGYVTTRQLATAAAQLDDSNSMEKINTFREAMKKTHLSNSEPELDALTVGNLAMESDEDSEEEEEEPETVLGDGKGSDVGSLMGSGSVTAGSLMSGSITQGSKAAGSQAGSKASKAPVKKEKKPPPHEAPLIPHNSEDPTYIYTSRRALQQCRGDHAALIDGQWLIRQAKKGGETLCRQELPRKAYFNGNVEDESVVVLAISCPWLTREHPDPEGWHLSIIAQYLELYFKLERKKKGKVTGPPEGRGKRVAVFWDWMSLYQDQFISGRTRDQGLAFKDALSMIEVWFANRHTMVWRQTKLPPAPRPGFDIKPYAKRGWCFLEQTAAEILTPAHNYLDLGAALSVYGKVIFGFTPDGQEILPEEFYNGKPPPADTSRKQPHIIRLFEDGWTAARNDEQAHDRRTVAKQCGKIRKIPVNIETFNDKLKDMKFTSHDDILIVQQAYERLYRALIIDSHSLDISNCNYEAPLVSWTTTLVHNYDHIEVLNLSDNSMIGGYLQPLHMFPVLETLDVSKCPKLKSLMTGLEPMTQITDLNVGDNQQIEGLISLQYLTNLRRLKMQNCRALTGSLGPLATLTDLIEINFTGCYDYSKATGVSGDFRPLENLTQLEYLRLGLCPKLQGNLSSLGKLHQLKVLDVKYAKQTRGDLMDLQQLTQLETLNLYYCRFVTGDLGALQRLRNLMHVNLSACFSISGDIGPLKNLTRLTSLDIAGRQFQGMNIRGDLESLRELENLVKLDIRSCHDLDISEEFVEESHIVTDYKPEDCLPVWGRTPAEPGEVLKTKMLSR